MFGNGTASNSDVIAAFIQSENNEEEGTWKEVAMANLMYCPNICLEGPGNIVKKNQDSQCLNPDINPKDKAGMLITWSQIFSYQAFHSIPYNF